MTDKIIEINEEKVKNHLGEYVRQTVEETLNTLLDEEAAPWRSFGLASTSPAQVATSGQKDYLDAA